MLYILPAKEDPKVNHLIHFTLSVLLHRGNFVKNLVFEPYHLLKPLLQYTSNKIKLLTSNQICYIEGGFSSTLSDFIFII